MHQQNNRKTTLPSLMALSLLLTGSVIFANDLTTDSGASPGPVAAKLQPFIDSHKLIGAVTLVATKDKILDVEAVGFADIDSAKPMRVNTMFWIASQSKAMTAAALMMLVDEGKIGLDDPVEKYLPEFKGQMVKGDQNTKVPADHPIRIREILSHTSGLPFGSPFEKPTLDGSPLAERVNSYAKLTLDHQPGTFYAYSNAGINTAGRIVEVVSGEPYEKFMAERLFQPLGMTDTTFWPDAEQVSRLASSYTSNPDKTGLVKTTITQLKYPLDGPGRYPMPAGGLFSTAADVAKFCQMMLNRGTYNGQQILTEASIHEMTTRQTGPGIKESYGFGLNITDSGFRHSGYYQTNMEVNTKLNLITVYLVQQLGGWPHGSMDYNTIFNRVAREIQAKPAQ